MSRPDSDGAGDVRREVRGCVSSALPTPRWALCARPSVGTTINWTRTNNTRSMHFPVGESLSSGPDAHAKRAAPVGGRRVNHKPDAISASASGPAQTRRTMAAAIRSAIGTVAEQFRALGPAEGLLATFTLVVETATRRWARVFRYHLMVQPVARQGKAVPGSSARVERVLHDHPVVATFPRPPEIIAGRFAVGCVCLVASVRDRFAGFLWLAFDRYCEDEVRCTYVLRDSARSAWDFDVYIEPEFRLGRTFTRLWEAADRELGARGATWSFSRISTLNAASLAAHRRLGARRIASATFVCLGPVQLSFFGVRPFVHLSWSRDSAPTIVLAPPAETAV
jgi:hypothetical protein